MLKRAWVYIVSFLAILPAVSANEITDALGTIVELIGPIFTFEWLLVVGPETAARIALGFLFFIATWIALNKTDVIKGANDVNTKRLKVLTSIIVTAIGMVFFPVTLLAPVMALFAALIPLSLLGVVYYIVQKSSLFEYVRTNMPRTKGIITLILLFFTFFITNNLLNPSVTGYYWQADGLFSQDLLWDLTFLAFAVVFLIEVFKFLGSLFGGVGQVATTFKGNDSQKENWKSVGEVFKGMYNVGMGGIGGTARGITATARGIGSGLGKSTSWLSEQSSRQWKKWLVSRHRKRRERIRSGKKTITQKMKDATVGLAKWGSDKALKGAKGVLGAMDATANAAEVATRMSRGPYRKTSNKAPVNQQSLDNLREALKQGNDGLDRLRELSIAQGDAQDGARVLAETMSKEQKNINNAHDLYKKALEAEKQFRSIAESPNAERMYQRVVAYEQELNAILDAIKQVTATYDAPSVEMVEKNLDKILERAVALRQQLLDENPRLQEIVTATLNAINSTSSNAEPTVREIQEIVGRRKQIKQKEVNLDRAEKKNLEQMEKDVKTIESTIDTVLKDITSPKRKKAESVVQKSAVIRNKLANLRSELESLVEIENADIQLNNKEKLYLGFVNQPDGQSSIRFIEAIKQAIDRCYYHLHMIEQDAHDIQEKGRIYKDLKQDVTNLHELIGSLAVAVRKRLGMNKRSAKSVEINDESGTYKGTVPRVD